MSGIELRTARPADARGIAEGFAAATGSDARGLQDEVAGLLAARPPRMSGIVAETSGGRIAGHVGAVHLPMNVRGERRTFGRLHACFIAPPWRLGGVHALVLDLLEAFASTGEGADRLALVSGRLAEADWWFLRRVAGFEAVASGLYLDREPRGPYTAPPRVAAVRFDGGLAGEWKTGLPFSPCAVVRDRAWALARIAGPWAGDEIWCAVRDGEVVGVTIVRPEATQRVVLDWTSPHGDWDVIEALMSGAVGDGRLPLRSLAWNLSHWIGHALQEAGFRIRAGDEPYLVARSSLPSLSRHWLAENWVVFPEGGSLTPLPPMTAEASIVTPPPVGTAGRRNNLPE